MTAARPRMVVPSRPRLHVVASDGPVLRLPAQRLNLLLTGVPGPPGTPGINNEVRSDFDSDTETAYIGRAPSGSAEDEAVWAITRIHMLDVGGTEVTTATDVAWDDRLTEVYV